MASSLFSIIIPCFNAEATIAESLDSIPPSSSSQAIEVIVVDDGSTDRSAAVVQQVRPDAILISQANQGASAARNRGISIARGDWIQFLDADDTLLPQTLEQRLNRAHQTDADVVVTDWIQFNDSPRTIPAQNHQEADLASTSRSADWQTCQEINAEIGCATSFWAPPAAVFYSRSIVQKVGAFRNDLPIIQDARFLFDAAYHGARIAHLATPGARYRICTASLSRRNPTAFWIDCLRNGQQIEQLWLQRDSRLNQDQLNALQQIYAGAAQALIRAGNPGAFAAAAALQGTGGTLNRELSYGLHLLNITGSTMTRSAFTLGRIARALSRRMHQGHPIST